MTEVDLTGTRPCPVPGCRLSAEEHHRVNVGLVVENAQLRKQVRGEVPVPPSLAETISRELPALRGLVAVLTAASEGSQPEQTYASVTEPDASAPVTVTHDPDGETAHPASERCPMCSVVLAPSAPSSSSSDGGAA